MKNLDDFLEKKYKIFFIITSVLTSIFYLLLAGGQYVWGDEAYTFAMIKHSYREIWRITAADVHPPLYYYYLKSLTKPFHYSMLSAKIATIFPYSFIIIWGGLQIKKLFSARTSLLFMIFFFFFPFALPYSVEIRMYSLAAAFVFACAIFAYRVVLDYKLSNWIGFIVFGAAAAYTHYFALVSVGIIYAIILFQVIIKKESQHIRQWFLFSAFTILIYAPWLNCFFAQLEYKINNEYWIKPITLRSIIHYWKDLFGACGISEYPFYFSLCFFILILYLIIKRKEYKKELILGIYCLLVPLGTLFIGVAASIIIRPVFIGRYLLPSVPLMALFLAISLGKIKNESIISAILVVVIMGGISNYNITLYGEYNVNNYLPIEEYSDIDAYIVMAKGQVAVTLAYYVTEEPIYNWQTLSAATPALNRVSIDEFSSEKVNRAILLLDVGDMPQNQFTKEYNYEYLGEWICEESVDAFLLQKKQE